MKAKKTYHKCKKIECKKRERAKNEIKKQSSKVESSFFSSRTKESTIGTHAQPETSI